MTRSRRPLLLLSPFALSFASQHALIHSTRHASVWPVHPPHSPHRVAATPIAVTRASDYRMQRCWLLPSRIAPHFAVTNSLSGATPAPTASRPADLPLLLSQAR